MSYTRPLTPRFYCDWVNWLLAEGKMKTSDITDNFPTAGGIDWETGSTLIECFDMTPSNLQTIDCDTESDDIIIEVDTNIGSSASQESSFLAIMGHNLNQAGAKITVKLDNEAESDETEAVIAQVLNLGSKSGNTWTPANNGYTIATWDSGSAADEKVRLVISTGTTYTVDIKIGCILIGKYIDMPNAPDVNIKRTLNEGEGGKINTTDGGMDFSNLRYASAPNWFLSPYEVGTAVTPDKVRRSGRLMWDLNFSFVADTNFTPETWSSGNIMTGDTIHNILQYTIGSHLPFLYSWDNTAKGAYDFCMARVHRKPEIMKTNNVWSIGMQIVERY
ncbi:hypothetical protein HN682_08375 [Candidatus Peregrinibacteria bacterium]|nr:hypothetical protein [Candidatus Peregrinibacteria bacterium]